MNHCSFIQSNGIGALPIEMVSHYHEKMIDHSSDDKVYNLIHATFENPEELEAAVEKSQFVLKKEYLSRFFI